LELIFELHTHQPAIETGSKKITDISTVGPVTTSYASDRGQYQEGVFHFAVSGSNLPIELTVAPQNLNELARIGLLSSTYGTGSSRITDLFFLV
jgi:hypothetical protein